MKLPKLIFPVLLFFTNCQDVTLKPMETVPYVDIEKFMGDWYVIANIPTFLEKGATNAIESYELNDKGEVETYFSYFKNSPQGTKKEYFPKGFIVNKDTNAEWKMQFLWPFKASFLIIDLDQDYSYTVIGVPSRKYVWIMAREPEIPQNIYQGILSRLQKNGYDLTKLQMVPQIWN